MEKHIRYKNIQLSSDILLPEKCRFCDIESVKPDKCLCSYCEETTVVIKEFCNWCGCNKDKCKCSRQEMLFSGVRSGFVYSGAVRQGIHNWKFRGNIDATQYFASNMAEKLYEDLKERKFDILTFVPQTENEKQQRGYNQSELLAKILGVYIGMEPCKVLCKVYETKKQRDLPGILRTGNVLGAFDVKDRSLIFGKRIILVDDVKTTGSVLNECAKMLMIYGAEEVLCTCAAVVE